MFAVISFRIYSSQSRYSSLTKSVLRRVFVQARLIARVLSVQVKKRCCTNFRPSDTLTLICAPLISDYYRRNRDACTKTLFYNNGNDKNNNNNNEDNYSNNTTRIRIHFKYWWLLCLSRFLHFFYPNETNDLGLSAGTPHYRSTAMTFLVSFLVR